jgi:hypothetical protein
MKRKRTALFIGRNQKQLWDELGKGIYPEKIPDTIMYGGPGFLGHENEVNLRVQGGRQ